MARVKIARLWRSAHIPIKVVALSFVPSSRFIILKQTNNFSSLNLWCYFVVLNFVWNAWSLWNDLTSWEVPWPLECQEWVKQRLERALIVEFGVKFLAALLSPPEEATEKWGWRMRTSWPRILDVAHFLLRSHKNVGVWDIFRPLGVSGTLPICEL